MTPYQFHVEVVSVNGETFQNDHAIVATTTNATVPGPVSKLNVVESDGGYVEIQWNAVVDNGGSPVLRHELYLNGFLASQTLDGTTVSVALEGVPMLAQYTLTVRAINLIGPGPPTEITVNAIIDQNELPAPQTLVPTSVLGGSITFDINYPAGSSRTESLVVEQCQASSNSFIPSITVVNGTSITVYKLMHETLYTFRAYFRASNGRQSAYSLPILLKTSRRDHADKTPTPVVLATTGT